MSFLQELTQRLGGGAGGPVAEPRRGHPTSNEDGREGLAQALGMSEEEMREARRRQLQFDGVALPGLGGGAPHQASLADAAMAANLQRKLEEENAMRGAQEETDAAMAAKLQKELEEQSGEDQATLALLQKLQLEQSGEDPATLALLKKLQEEEEE